MFIWPTSNHRSGGVRVLYEFANGLARRGHEVHFVHGPAWPGRINTLDRLWHPFEPGVVHHIIDDLDDPSLPEADVVFNHDLPARHGLPAALVQGFRMLPPEFERAAFQAPGPKACVARWLLDVCADFGVSERRLWYVPMGMDHKLFADRRPAADRRYDVALWCNPHPTKGWPVGWTAVVEARRRRPDLRVVVFAATQPDVPLDLGPGVDLRVGLDQRGLADEVYNEARVFVQPSFHEGFGFTAVEAMACGAALVTTDNGGSRDYAFDGETAVVVPPDDAAGLVDGLLSLLDDEERRQRLARAGERHTRNFDWDRGSAILEADLLRYLDEPEAFLRETAEDAHVTACGRHGPER
jgi:glycosyltransferase involved in cell wall biosynthesis